MGWKFWQKDKKASTPQGKPKLSEAEQAAADKAFEADYARWYDEKSAMMETALGKEHDMVVHAIISYEMGGALHSYLYPNGIAGTGLATKQLARLENDDTNELYEGNGPSNTSYDSFEFVIFTREDIVSKELSDDPDDRFFQMRALLNCFAPYAEQVQLNKYETIGIPEDWDAMAGSNVILDTYKPEFFNKDFGLMLIMEIFPSELEYKTKNGGDALIDLLKQADHYPYSDLNRNPVA